MNGVTGTNGITGTNGVHGTLTEDTVPEAGEDTNQNIIFTEETLTTTEIKNSQV